MRRKTARINDEVFVTTLSGTITALAYDSAYVDFGLYGAWVPLELIWRRDEFERYNSTSPDFTGKN